MHSVEDNIDLWRSLERHCREAAQAVTKRDLTMVRFYVDTVRSEIAYMEREIEAASAVSGIGEE